MQPRRPNGRGLPTQSTTEQGQNRQNSRRNQQIYNDQNDKISWVSSGYQKASSGAYNPSSTYNIPRSGSSSTDLTRQSIDSIKTDLENIYEEISGTGLYDRVSRKSKCLSTSGLNGGDSLSSPPAKPGRGLDSSIIQALYAKVDLVRKRRDRIQKQHTMPSLKEAPMSTMPREQNIPPNVAMIHEQVPSSPSSSTQLSSGMGVMPGPNHPYGTIIPRGGPQPGMTCNRVIMSAPPSDPNLIMAPEKDTMFLLRDNEIYAADRSNTFAATPAAVLRPTPSRQGSMETADRMETNNNNHEKSVAPDFGSKPIKSYFFGSSPPINP